jgi:hypothetical protein
VKSIASGAALFHSLAGFWRPTPTLASIEALGRSGIGPGHYSVEHMGSLHSRTEQGSHCSGRCLTGTAAFASLSGCAKSATRSSSR